jgi:transcriptional regulator GlxA family with amidase domain
MSRRLALVIFPNFQLLDVAGPIAVFEIAERLRPGSYDLTVEAVESGQIPSSSGVCLAARPLSQGPLHTVMVSGGDGTRDVESLQGIVRWLRAVEVQRPTSVCSGAYLLAEAGLLDGRRATTHWSRTDDFARRYPKVKVDADRIYIRDGHVWTSGGITAGIDLALALVEEDLGSEIARRTAQQLVVHQRRPGGQSQFSGLLDLGGRSGRFDTLLAWMAENLSTQLTVEMLADQAAMSPRNFARAFVAETGVTPAKAVERLRLDAARTAVETGRAPLDQVAVETGFADPERMRRAFLRAFGQPPQALRRAARA